MEFNPKRKVKIVHDEPELAQYKTYREHVNPHGIKVRSIVQQPETFSISLGSPDFLYETEMKGHH